MMKGFVSVRVCDLTAQAHFFLPLVHLPINTHTYIYKYIPSTHPLTHKHKHIYIARELSSAFRKRLPAQLHFELDRQLRDLEVSFICGFVMVVVVDGLFGGCCVFIVVLC